MVVAEIERKWQERKTVLRMHLEDVLSGNSIDSTRGFWHYALHCQTQESEQSSQREPLWEEGIAFE